MRVGFTGTRQGMTNVQHQAFIDLMWTLKPTEFRHGACVGADEQAAHAVFVMSHAPVSIHAHPGKSATGGHNDLLSAKAVEVSGVVHDADTHFARNRAIVNTTEVLVATPWQTSRPKPKTGGGTWYTIEYAEKQGKAVYIIWPDGRVDAVASTTFARIP